MFDCTWVPLTPTIINSLVAWLNDHGFYRNDHGFFPDTVMRITQNSNSVLITFQDDTWIRISKDQLETKEVSS